jgi:hypothetical protein
MNPHFPNFVQNHFVYWVIASHPGLQFAIRLHFVTGASRLVKA